MNSLSGIFFPWNVSHFLASRGGKLPDKAEAAVEDYSEVVRLMEEDPESSEGLRKGCRGMDWGW